MGGDEAGDSGGAPANKFPGSVDAEGEQTNEGDAGIGDRLDVMPVNE